MKGKRDINAFLLQKSASATPLGLVVGIPHQYALQTACRCFDCIIEKLVFSFIEKGKQIPFGIKIPKDIIFDYHTHYSRKSYS